MSWTKEDRLCRIQARTYNGRNVLYGVEMEYRPDGSVRIAAPLLPAGKAVRTWYSVTDYQRDRMEPALPILAEGNRYLLQACYRDVPAGGLLLVLRFMDREGEPVGMQVAEGSETPFTYPRGAYQYTLELVQGGFDQVIFEYAEIWTLQEDQEEAGNHGK